MEIGSTELVRVGHCRVCGQAVAEASCACTACHTTAHAECFAYAGGCSIFGCGSISARFVGAAPAGWRAEADGVWLIPADAVEASKRKRPVGGPLTVCLRHWRTTAQLEMFSVLGQAWFAVVALVAAGSGRWTMHPALVATVAAVLAAHACTLLGLARLGLIMTSPDPEDRPIDDRPLRAVASRVTSIQWSRRLHILGTVLFAAGIAAGGFATNPSYVWVVAAFSALVPWFSLAPRWYLELPMLEAAGAPRLLESTAA